MGEGQRNPADMRTGAAILSSCSLRGTQHVPVVERNLCIRRSHAATVSAYASIPPTENWGPAYGTTRNNTIQATGTRRWAFILDRQTFSNTWQPSF